MGKWYYFDASGYMVTGNWLTSWHNLVLSECRMVTMHTGWLNLGGS
ncbi:MAG: hypothetical protein ACLVAT_10695 [Lachnospiraceae bacterium]